MATSDNLVNNKRPDIKHVITYIFSNKKYNKYIYDLQLLLLLLSEAKAIVTQAPTIKEINKWASSLKHRNSNRTNYLWTFVCMYICIYIYVFQCWQINATSCGACFAATTNVCLSNYHHHQRSGLTGCQARQIGVNVSVANV